MFVNKKNLAKFRWKLYQCGACNPFCIYISCFPSCIPKFTRFFITDIPQFFIATNFPQMRNKFTAIKLKFGISIIIFEHSEKSTETIIGPTEPMTKPHRCSKKHRFESKISQLHFSFMFLNQKMFSASLKSIKK